MPSVIIILIVARFLEKFRENRYVNAAMYGLRAASVALISSAGISIVMIAVFQINSIEEWKAAVIDYRCFVRFLFVVA
jgi:chromate transporter